MADSGTQEGHEKLIAVVKVDAKELVREIRALSEKLDRLPCISGNKTPLISCDIPASPDLTPPDLGMIRHGIRKLS